MKDEYRPTTWVSSGKGMFVGLEEIDDKQTCMSFRTAVIDGHKVLFYNATSMYVDHKMIREWLDEYLPDTARQVNAPSQIVNTDANNFHNVFHYVNHAEHYAKMKAEA